MFLRVQKVMDAYASVWNGNSKITANYQTLVQHITTLKELHRQRGTGANGISQQKKALKDKMIDQTLRLLKATQSYAADTNDKTLQVRLDFSRSDFTRQREIALPNFCEQLRLEIAKHVANLSEYGVTPTSLDELAIIRSQFDSISPDARLAISAGKVVTGNLSDLFKTTVDLLGRQLDGKIEQYRDAHADFYRTYTNARTIIELGKGQKAEETGVATINA